MYSNHKLIWFVNRIGEYIWKDTGEQLTRIEVKSPGHARAMHLSQKEKRIKYYENGNVDKS